MGLRFLPFPGPSSSGDEVFGQHGRCNLSPPLSLLFGFLGVQPAHLLRWMVTVQNPRKSSWQRSLLTVWEIMSLWSCDCPLPALAACHRRVLVCSWLSLFSPLFCAQAWQCLKLGLAFRMVVIPQSGLLAQVSLLRLHSGHSGQILTLSNAGHASRPSPRLLVAGAGICALLCWGSYHLAHNLWVLIIYFSSLLCCLLCFQGSPQTQQ